MTDTFQSALTKYRKQTGTTQGDLAHKLNVQASAVCKWERGRVPAERVIDVERVTGISREQLRPDIYPPKEEVA